MRTGWPHGTFPDLVISWRPTPGVSLKLANLDKVGKEPITFEDDYYKGSVKIYAVGKREDPQFQLKVDIKWVGLGMRFDAVGLDLLEYVPSRFSK